MGGMRALSFTDAERDLEGEILGKFFCGGDFDLVGERKVALGRLLVLERDLNLDCNTPSKPAGLRVAGRLVGDLDGARFLGGERLRESERR